MSLDDLKSRNDLSLDEIVQLMDVETNIKIYKKLLYFKFKAMGFTIIESYSLASIKKSTAYNLEDNWNEGGYNALLPKSGQGRKFKLNGNQLAELELILKTRDKWLVNDIVNLIKEKWKIEYSYVGVKNLLERRFNVKIDNYYDVEQNKIKNSGNLVENFSNLNDDEKKELVNLIGLIKEERNVRVLKKLFYIMFKKLSFSTKLSSHFLSVTTVTGNNWLNRWKKEGYNGLLHKKGQGRKPIFNNEELTILKKN